MKIVYVTHDFHHHGHHSGYQMLAHAMAATPIVESQAILQIVRAVPKRLLRLVPSLHPRWYYRKALALEIDIVISLPFRTPTVFHYLYGEHTYRWSNRANRNFGNRHRMVCTYHQLPIFFEQRRKSFDHVRGLDAAILVASNQRGFFETIMDPARAFVVPHGVDTHFFTPDTNFLHTRTSPFRCLSVGSNYRDINLHRKVIHHLERQKINIEFIVVGNPQFASEFKGLRSVRYLSKLSDNELLKEYQTADILLLPLLDGTACNAQLEGMACGLPQVATDVGGVRDYADDTFTVFVPPNDADAMVEAVLSLAQAPQRRIDMGRRARHKAVLSFDWVNISRQLQNIYTQLWEK